MDLGRPIGATDHSHNAATDIPRPIPVEGVPIEPSAVPTLPSTIPPPATQPVLASAHVTPGHASPVAASAPAVHPHDRVPTSTIDPNVPSSESAPTALPTNPATHPREQQQAIKDEHPAVVAREVEKTKAAAREVKGEKPKGTVVSGLEDDRLWQMLRRFDVVSHTFSY